MAQLQLRLSDEFYKLEPKVKARYQEKIAIIENQDPYTIKKSEFSKDVSFLVKNKYITNKKYQHTLWQPL